MTFPEWLEKNGLSTYAAASILKINRMTLDNLLKGRHRPNLTMVDRIEHHTRASRAARKTIGVVTRLDWPRLVPEDS